MRSDTLPEASQPAIERLANHGAAATRWAGAAGMNGNRPDNTITLTEPWANDAPIMEHRARGC